MGELFQVTEDPGRVEQAYPGAVTNIDGSANPQELTRARPTGYLPDARTLPQVPYNRDRDTSGVIEYDPAFPVGLFDTAERVDQHAMLHVTAAITAPDEGPRRTGTRDPMDSGPARPDTILLSLFAYRGPGTSKTSYQDVPDGRRFSPYGPQDGSSWTIYQDATAALSWFNDTGQPVPADRSQTPTAQPTLARLAPGPAHGWTSTPVVNAKQSEIDKARQLAQQASPHQDRKANSTVAGQSFSQRTVSVRQAAGSAGPTPGADQAWW